MKKKKEFFFGQVKCSAKEYKIMDLGTQSPFHKDYYIDIKTKDNFLKHYRKRKKGFEKNLNNLSIQETKYIYEVLKKFKF